MGVQNPQSITRSLYSIGGRSESGFPAINPNNNWRIAAPFRLHRVDTMRQLTHKPESGAYAFWRWASTKHPNTKRPAWQGGHPPFRVTVFRDGVSESEITWVRTQSVVDPTKYDHTYPTYGYDHTFQPDLAENGTTINYSYLIESQDGQALVIRAPTQVDNSRFKYFAQTPAGNNANAGTFEAPYETFGYGYASVANAHTYIYCYKAGTYNVHNGTVMNDAAFNSTHCKSHIGIEPGVIMDVSTGHFSNGASDISIAKFAVIGGRADRADVRQFDLSAQCVRFSAHGIVSLTVQGLTGGDNPSGFMFWNLTSPAYHEDIAFTDCVLAAGSTAQFATFFQCKNAVIENFRSDSVAATANNGAQHIYPKDGCLNFTIRHCELVGSAGNGGMLGVASQDWESCGNIDIHFCKIVNLLSGAATVSRWNLAVDLAGEQKPQDYYIQRCDVDAYQTSPFTFENYEEVGYPVNYSAIRWESTSSTFNNGADAGGGVSVGETTVKVADINTYSADDLGIRGYKISSTLVT